MPIEVRVSAGVLVVAHRLPGETYRREPNVILRLLFADILSQGRGSQASVDLHFEKLDFFNSSTIGSSKLGRGKVANRVTTIPITMTEGLLRRDGATNASRQPRANARRADGARNAAE
jgi:hypothetical protein